MPLIIKLGKKVKAAARKLLPAPEPRLSWSRRISQIKTKSRICAMTFDDGPMDLPAVPDRFHGRAVTDLILDVLAEYDAKGTFDVIGDTSENYPDKRGRLGTTNWGGVAYDHYPDFGRDEHGGALHCERIIRRMIDEGHQITNHSYRHLIYGRENIIYRKRRSLDSFDAAVADLTRLDSLLRDRDGYQMTMTRPPHYVNRVEKGLTAYDVCDAMGYQYLAASFDGAGWMSDRNPDPEAALEAEIRAMVEPVRKALEKDPDCFCGQIIFQKDGGNMQKRTPVVYGLRGQLELLRSYGYRVVTVAELMEESPFADLGREDPLFDKLNALQRDRTIVYSDNHLRLDRPMTLGELALLLCPREEAVRRRLAIIRRSGPAAPAAGALDWCAEQGLLPGETDPKAPVTALPEGLFGPTTDFTRRGVYAAYRSPSAE